MPLNHTAILADRAAGLTQKEVAARYGCSVKSVWAIEQKQAAPPPPVAQERRKHCVRRATRPALRMAQRARDVAFIPRPPGQVARDNTYWRDWRGELVHVVVGTTSEAWNTLQREQLRRRQQVELLPTPPPPEVEVAPDVEVPTPVHVEVELLPLRPLPPTELPPTPPTRIIYRTVKPLAAPWYSRVYAAWWQHDYRNIIAGVVIWLFVLLWMVLL